MSEKRSVLVVSDTGMNKNEVLESKLSTEWKVSVMSIHDNTEAFLRLLASCDALVGGRLGRELPKNSKLKLYQVPFTGFDWIKPADLPAGALLCNTYEHETTIAEHLLAAMLEWQTGLIRDTDPDMRVNSFNGRSINNGPHHLEMRGSTVGIIGYGHIGREVAKRCKAFDMKVMAVSRTLRNEPDLVDWYGRIDQLDDLLMASDFIVSCLPGGEETRSMINKSSFKLMRPGAIVANVGRGEVIDEAALYEALASRSIRGAIIDVWYNYPSDTNQNPWPSRFPMHKLDNVIMSPHNSAWTCAMSDRRWNFVAANLDRFARGQDLQNVCFRGERVD
ncbi:MAG: phosphoglycerate dehydrogenase [Rhodospirillaceae bacterium]|nr:phosphoglycerate dehydrogenase [Rhodospirillaceae bacterium]|tara:strand:+ start:193 stop:1194 length:1002 start_codon:yes stop_codon:yes gene_type:complete